MTYKQEGQGPTQKDTTMTRATTESADFLFAVKEHADGTPFVMLEPRTSGLASLGTGFLALNLRKGQTIEDAQRLTEQLNASIKNVSHTRFEE